MYLIAITVIGLSSSVLFAQSELNHLLGPRVGEKHIYYYSNGIRLEREGLYIDDEGKLAVKEKTIYPDDMFPPEIPKESEKISLYYVKHGELIKEDEGYKYILIKEPIEINSKSWVNKLYYYGKNNSQDSLKSESKIADIKEEEVRGKLRKVITIECTIKNKKEDYTVVIRDRLAYDIGSIESSYWIGSFSSDQEDEFELGYEIELVDIIKKENSVKYGPQ